ncbi:NrfD/PsrC family molybdoenzyme membrane anchor subunit [Sulfuriroseicoccus oceanibius]|uniref:Polysulfide reductase NrfD n=1 Tax=Sulfuriroseicoccus oceanibius TaxID=2707525 RepID=A0A6B3LEC9_9BACT|nr:NrfD/PsrC family molybdoenzyme membrane anchor subunit [Sulfuriroseicoccus oceanibius]QQL44639.1 polysulfide reductase NrfD [Sulfuriroseicoccus oceanibius]
MADATTAKSSATASAGQPQLEVLEREELILNNRSYAWITDRICGIVENRMPLLWWIIFIPSAIIALLGVGGGLTYLVSTGVGVWGNNNSLMWGWPIVNFVFWIGIGHAGTLISAILFLTRQNWRTSINRAAEAMTIFAVCCAGIFPAFHVGRVWMAWFLAPIPNANAIWQNFKSPLLWDVFAVSTYFTVSLIFWYIGMVPDLASIRDRAKNKFRKFAYGVLALGWRGGNRQWRHYEMCYLLLAALSTPLVLSVHTIVSFDFATSVVPGWHTTIFPPYFVAGAIFGGFAMVLTMMVPARKIFGLEDLITMKHIDNMAKIIAFTGCLVGYAYLMELFIAWYGQNKFEWAAFAKRIGADEDSPYAWSYFVMMFCNVVSPQFFWFEKCRKNLWVVMGVAMLVNIGMWFERFVIIVTTLARMWFPGDWQYYSASPVDVMTFVGTIGMFLALFMLFLRFLPCVNIAEVKWTLLSSNVHHDEMEEAKKAAGAKCYEADGEVITGKRTGGNC